MTEILTDWGYISIRELRRLLSEDRSAEQKRLEQTSCVCCGKRLKTETRGGIPYVKYWSGGAGRRLCRSCGKAESGRRSASKLR